MLNRWTGVSVFLLAALVAARAQDAMTVIDINPPAGQLVESASVLIPEGVFVAFSFHTANTNGHAEGSQGVKLDFGGRIFTMTQNAPAISTTNPIVASSTLLGSSSTSTLLGPFRISAFCSNAPARLQIYTQSQTDTSVVSGQLFDNNTVEVVLSAGELLFVSSLNSTFGTVTDFSVPSGGVFAGQRSLPTYLVTNSSGSVSTMSNIVVSNPKASGLGQTWVFGNGGETASQVMSGFSVPTAPLWNVFGRAILAPSQHIAGPATVTIKRDRWNTSGIGMYTYRKWNANYSASTSGQSGTNSSTNTNNTKTFTLQLQRSTNLKDWTVTDNYYISETASNAFYRLQPVASQ